MAAVISPLGDEISAVDTLVADLAIYHILAQQEAFYLLFIFNIIAVEKYEPPIFYCLLQHAAVFKCTLSAYWLNFLQTGKYFLTLIILQLYEA